MDLFVRIEGQTGPVTTPSNRSGWFRATAFEWGGMVQPRDAATGQLAGGRRHRPFVLVRAIDGASATFYESLIRSLNQVVTVAADVPDGKGGLRPAATWTLRAASVAKYELSAVNGGADNVTERVELTYGTIEVQQDPSVAKYQDNFSGA